MNMDFNLFMNDVVRQARQEITAAGYTELKTAEEVDEALSKKEPHSSWSTLCADAQAVLHGLPRTIPYITINARISL